MMQLCARPLHGTLQLDQVPTPSCILVQKRAHCQLLWCANKPCLHQRLKGAPIFLPWRLSLSFDHLGNAFMDLIRQQLQLR